MQYTSPVVVELAYIKLLIKVMSLSNKSNPTANDSEPV